MLTRTYQGARDQQDARTPARFRRSTAFRGGAPTPGTAAYAQGMTIATGPLASMPSPAAAPMERTTRAGPIASDPEQGQRQHDEQMSQRVGLAKRELRRAWACGRDHAGKQPCGGREHRSGQLVAQQNGKDAATAEGRRAGIR